MLINYNEYLKNKYYFNLNNEINNLNLLFSTNKIIKDYEILKDLKKLYKINNELNYIYKNEKNKIIKDMINKYNEMLNKNLNNDNNYYINYNSLYFNLFDLLLIIKNEIKFNLKSINLKKYNEIIGVNKK